MSNVKAHKPGNQLRIIGGQWRSRKLQFPDIEGLRPTPDRVRETLFNWLQPIIHGARCLDLFAGSGALGFEALSRGAAEVVMVDRDPQVIASLRKHIDTLQAQGARVVQADALGYLQQTEIPPHPPLQRGEQCIEAGEDAANIAAKFDIASPNTHSDNSRSVVQTESIPPFPLLPTESVSPPLKKGGQGGFSQRKCPPALFDIVFLDPPFRHNLLEACCQWLSHHPWLTPQARVYLEAESELQLPALPENWRITHSKRAGEVGYYLAVRE